MAKFRREDETAEYRPAKSGGNTVFLVALAAGGLIFLACAGIAAVGFFSARTAVREAEVMRDEVTARAAQIEAEQAVDEVRVFRDKVSQFLTAARGLAKALTTSPPPDDPKQKITLVADLYAELVAVPPEVDDTGYVAERLRGIRDALASAEQTARLGGPNRRKGVEEDLAKVVADVDRLANEVEAKLGITPAGEQK